MDFMVSNFSGSAAIPFGKVGAQGNYICHLKKLHLLNLG